MSRGLAEKTQRAIEKAVDNVLDKQIEKLSWSELRNLRRFGEELEKDGAPQRVGVANLVTLAGKYDKLICAFSNVMDRMAVRKKVDSKSGNILCQYARVIADAVKLNSVLATLETKHCLGRKTPPDPTRVNPSFRPLEQVAPETHLQVSVAVTNIQQTPKPQYEPNPLEPRPERSRSEAEHADQSAIRTETA